MAHPFLCFQQNLQAERLCHLDIPNIECLFYPVLYTTPELGHYQPPNIATWLHISEICF